MGRPRRRRSASSSTPTSSTPCTWPSPPSRSAAAANCGTHPMSSSIAVTSSAYRARTAASSTTSSGTAGPDPDPRPSRHPYRPAWRRSATTHHYAVDTRPHVHAHHHEPSRHRPRSPEHLQLGAHHGPARSATRAELRRTRTATTTSMMIVSATNSHPAIPPAALSSARISAKATSAAAIARQ